MKKLVFTGGHHTGALEVAKALKARGWEIVWFGHRHSMWGDSTDSAEYQDVVAEGITFYNLQAGKFYKTFHPLKLLRIPWGFVQALVWLVRERPRGIVSFGGYLAVPTVLVGFVLGIPAITHEQTMAIGWANKVIGFLARKIALTWSESSKYFPQNKTEVVGLPVAAELTQPIKASRRKGLFIVGGKQGSHVLNQAVFAALPKLFEHFDLVWHQTGNTSLYHDFEHAQKLPFTNYHPFTYSRSKYLEYLRQASVVVARSGAHTVYDLGVLGKKAVLVPLSWASHQEQLKNAQVLQKNQLAIIILEEHLTPDRLIQSCIQALDLTGSKLQLTTEATANMVRLIESTLC